MILWKIPRQDSYSYSTSLYALTITKRCIIQLGKYMWYNLQYYSVLWTNTPSRKFKVEARPNPKSEGYLYFKFQILTHLNVETYFSISDDRLLYNARSRCAYKSNTDNVITDNVISSRSRSLISPAQYAMKLIIIEHSIKRSVISRKARFEKLKSAAPRRLWMKSPSFFEHNTLRCAAHAWVRFGGPCAFYAATILLYRKYKVQTRPRRRSNSTCNMWCDVSRLVLCPLSVVFALFWVSLSFVVLDISASGRSKVNIPTCCWLCALAGLTYYRRWLSLLVG